jgi:hypothetical protein
MFFTDTKKRLPKLNIDNNSTWKNAVLKRPQIGNNNIYIDEFISMTRLASNINEKIFNFFVFHLKFNCYCSVFISSIVKNNMTPLCYFM